MPGVGISYLSQRQTFYSSTEKFLPHQTTHGYKFVVPTTYYPSSSKKLGEIKKKALPHLSKKKTWIIPPIVTSIWSKDIVEWWRKGKARV